MSEIKVGILQLYFKLYDDAFPDLRFSFEPFINSIGEKLKEKGFKIYTSSICRVEDEFKSAIGDFEKNGVNVIVAVHLAYSLSLESIKPLINTKIPLVIFETTVKYDLSSDFTSEDIMLNHGIEGVQDLCNIMLRREKRFLIESGHWNEKDVIERVSEKIKSAAVLNNMNKSRTGIMGGFIKGVGDCFIAIDKLKEDLGIETISTKPETIVDFLSDIKENDIKNELDYNEKNYSIKKIDTESYLNSNKIGLAIRKWIEFEKLDAFTVNYFNLSSDSKIPTMPFIEASKAMARGTGYAAEGDILTASLLGSLLKVIPDCSFTEMYCPDWKNDIVLLSHMGEINVNLISGKPRIIIKNLPTINIDNPAILVGQFKEGDAVLVNLSLVKEKYTLILSRIEMVSRKNELEDTITGWAKTKGKVGKFLADYSQAGGSHHLILVYGDYLNLLMDFGKISGFDTVLV